MQEDNLMPPLKFIGRISAIGRQASDRHSKRIS